MYSKIRDYFTRYHDIISYSTKHPGLFTGGMPLQSEPGRTGKHMGKKAHH
jgi:hypothetical protein